MLTSIDRILEYARDVHFFEFAQTQMLIDAVLYNFVVIGEVAAQIKRRYLAFATENIELALAVSARMRNVIVHEYFRVKLFVVWQTIAVDLRPLRESTLRAREQA